MTILVTGANGFVGSALCRNLHGRGKQIRAALRRPMQHDGDAVTMPSLTSDADWTGIVADVEAVVHTAARVHIMRDTANDPLAEFRRVNTEGTLRLARQAAAAGVRRFVFVSTIKVNGEETEPGQAFTADSPVAPSDAYSISKYEAEQGLKELAATTNMEVVIVRPPLVYGPGVQANFKSMMRCLARGLPLPLGAIHNQRSLIALDNLADLLATCVQHPAAANQTFLASDGEDVSTTELLHRLARAMDRSARLIPVPAAALEFVGAVLGRPDVVRRLCASLQVDSSPAKTILEWSPVITLDAALRQTARHFLGA